MPKLARNKYRLAKITSELCLAITESSSARLHTEVEIVKRNEFILEYPTENTSSYSESHAFVEDQINYFDDSESLSDNEIQIEFLSSGGTDEHSKGFLSTNDDEADDPVFNFINDFCFEAGLKQRKQSTTQEFNRQSKIKPRRGQQVLKKMSK